MSELVQVARSLLTHTLRADRRVLVGLVEVADDDLVRETGAPFGTLLGTMAHILGMEQVWLSRFMGNPVAYFDDYPDYSSLREGFHEFWPECEFFVASLSPDQLVSDVVWAESEEDVRSCPLWQAVLEFSNHSTHHRGQVATLLRQLGYEAPGTDMMFYFQAR